MKNPDHFRVQINRQSPRLFSCPAQILENPGLTPKPFVLAQKVLVRVGRTGLIGDRLYPLVQGRKPDPQIRRNLTPRQAAGLGDANRIPLELAARVSLPCPVSLMASIALKKTGTKPGQVQCPRSRGMSALLPWSAFSRKVGAGQRSHRTGAGPEQV